MTRGFQEVKVPRLSDKVKVKQSHYRPGVARGFQEVKVPRLSDKVKVKQSHYRPGVTQTVTGS